MSPGIYGAGSDSVVAVSAGAAVVAVLVAVGGVTAVVAVGAVVAVWVAVGGVTAVVAVGVAVGVWVVVGGVTAVVAVAVAVPVLVAVAVPVAVPVAVGVGVAVAVSVGVTVGKTTGVWNWFGVGGNVAVGGPDVRVGTAVKVPGGKTCVAVLVGVGETTTGSVGGSSLTGASGAITSKTTPAM